MDRFKILKDVDPFADLPKGDACTYKFMGADHRGWRIDDDALIVDMGVNVLAYLEVLKKAAIEIHYKDDIKIEIFQIESIFKKTPFKDPRTKRDKVKVHFIGRVTKILTPNYILSPPPRPKNGR